jgi:hypothetical protein
LSSICRFLDEVAREENLSLTKDLEFLPSLIKCGVPGKLAGHLVRLRIPREAAVRIAALYSDKAKADDLLLPDLARPLSTLAEKAIDSLTEADIAHLHLSDAVVTLIDEIRIRIS